MTTKNIRFWHYWNGSPVKLTLRPGQRIELYECHETEEGHDGNRDVLRYEGSGEIHLNSENFGRDCDGPLSRESYYVSDEMAFDKDLGGMVPVWKEKHSSVYDGYAQAMGY